MIKKYLAREDILKEANDRAEEILKEANTKAQEILKVSDSRTNTMVSGNGGSGVENGIKTEIEKEDK